MDRRVVDKMTEEQYVESIEKINKYKELSDELQSVCDAIDIVDNLGAVSFNSIKGAGQKIYVDRHELYDQFRDDIKNALINLEDRIQMRIDELEI
jgi:hypothetical protein